MGAGLALEFRLRFPDMYNRYNELCQKGLFDIGKLWIYKDTPKQIINFPTKKEWKSPSQMLYIERGLQKFIAFYKKKSIKSVAFPLLGTDKGGLDKEEVLILLGRYLDNIDCIVEVYIHDPFAKDDKYGELETFFSDKSVNEISSATGIQVRTVNVIKDSIDNKQYCQINQLLNLPNVGVRTLEKIFQLNQYKIKQDRLF